MVAASVTADSSSVWLGPQVPLEESRELAATIVRYAARTGEAVVLGDAAREGRFAADPYIAARRPVSVLCVPITHQSRLSGVLYLENNVTSGAFSPARIELCRMLLSHAAVALENARLYARVQAVSDELRRHGEQLEEEVALRTEELSKSNEQLKIELIERQRAEEARAALQEEMLRVQASRVVELSTPLIPITKQIMVMPLIGTMDSARAQQMLETALHGAQSSRAAVVIIDITGVKLIDTAVAGTLIKTASALRMLGTKAVITGIGPEVARTLVMLDVDLGAVVTMGTLEAGIAYALATALGRALRSID
jgi:anti-anti-sigma regulatory factor